MKKLLLSFALAIVALFANGQALSKLWHYDAIANGLVVNSGSISNSVAYNKSTGRLYVAKRGAGIYIVNPADYSAGALNATAYNTLTSTLQLPTQAINAPSTSADYYHCSKVRVTDDGVIYAVAMHTGGNVIIYRWASETDAPTRHTFVASATVGSETRPIGRVGDSFEVFGTGDNTYLYVGNSNPNSTSTTNWVTGQYLTVLKVTAGIPALVNVFDLYSARHNDSFQDIGNRSISAEANNILWVNNHTNGVLPRRVILDLDAGTVSDFARISLNTTNYAAGIYIKHGNEEYYTTAGATSNTYSSQFQNIQLNKIGALNAATTPKTIAMTSLSSVSTDKTTSLVGNTGFSDIAYLRNVDNTTTFFFLSSNNGLTAFKTSVPLPVSLTSFDAALVRGQSTLTWETASETNNKGFQVLRSTDGKDFAKIDFVASKAQNGNSGSALSYSYVDRTAKAGINYYKLNQVDLDGKSELFEKAVSVNVSLSGADVVVFPNPATSYVSVNAGSADYKDVKYELFDAVGKKVMSEKAKAEQQDISLSKLPASVYYLKISKAGEVQKTVKLIKQ